MNLRTSQTAKQSPANPDPIHLVGAKPCLVCALAFFVLLGVGAIDRAAAQSRALPVKPFAQTQNAAFVAPTIHSATANDVIHLTVGHSAVLTSAVPLRRVYIGNPAVLASYCSGTAEIVLTAKTAGVSSMVLWDEAGGHRLYTVSADLDPDALRGSFNAAFPGSSIHVETGEGKIFLTGSVASDAASDAALKMASLYAKDVVNSLVVVPVHGKQVQLKLRIVEVDRTRLNQFGINIFTPGIGSTLGSASTQQFSSTATGSGSSLTVSDPLNIFLYNSKLNVGATVQDLEQKQILQVLAEPTLTTLSGLPARFLSGGEFPFPVVQGGTGNSTAISIQFRPYGVKVDFTPTVNADGSIRIKLAPEVSTLDYSNAVTISGFTIPALATRQTETEVEIQNGQSFIVSGLLDHRTTEIMSKVPGIASVPILGQLFRSKNFNHSVVELVIIVTATVVDPLNVVAAGGAGAAEDGGAQPRLQRLRRTGTQPAQSQRLGAGASIETPSANAIETASANAIETASANAIETASANAIETASANAIETASTNAIETPSANAIETASANANETASANAIETASANANETASANAIATSSANATLPARVPGANGLPMTSNTNLSEHFSQAIFCVCADGRRITHISEITGTSGDVISLQDIYLFEKLGLGPSGNVKGRFHSTGIVPKFGERLKAAGIPLGLKLLDHSVKA